VRDILTVAFAFQKKNSAVWRWV